MDKKITNKRVGIVDIINIAELMERHAKYYKDLETQEKRKKEEAKSRDEYYNMKYVSSEVKYVVQYNNNERIEKTNELDWFKSQLIENASQMTEASIIFRGSEENSREFTSISFHSNRIYYDTSITNMSSNSLAYMIENYINGLPARFDELVQNDTRRTMIPALTFSIPFAIILSVVLLIVGKINSIGILTNGFLLAGVAVVVAFFGALLIPTKNTDLYKHIKFETYYAGYNEKTFKSIRKNDYAEYKSKCEVAIGENWNMPNVRLSIEANYTKAKKIVPIELIVMAVAIVIFFVV